MKDMAEKILLRIIEINSKNSPEAIPHSDSFYKDMGALYGLKRYELDEIIELLRESHRIFVIEINKEDHDHDIKRIDGFVEADLTTVRRLKNYFQKLLMDEFEMKKSKRLHTHQIINEMYANPDLYINTTLGMIGNKAIMLEEYENLIEKKYSEYTESWKLEAFHKLLEEIENEKKGQAREKGNDEEREAVLEETKRAVDFGISDSYTVPETRTSLKKQLQIYGAETFCRINLRKYNFPLIKDMVQSGMINRKDELKSIKAMIQKMKSNTDRDPKLKEFAGELDELERTVSRYIVISRK